MRDLRKILASAIAELDEEEERARRRNRTAEERAARGFLERLDAESQEGMWFEALAEKMPNRLEAAIAYLREVKKE